MLLPLFLTQFLLSALSITNLGLISSMVAFLHIQKYGPGYPVRFSPSENVQMKALPAHIWLDQGHTSNGVAGTKVRNMEAWRWMLIPIFLTDVLGLVVAEVAFLGARREKRVSGTEKGERIVDAQ
ncbi:hypothetical protein E2P81_ATG11086 [Venturia nashicola]|nr:hypothetical protein E2P81_ATG11086 [Venturia nashicola]